MQQAIVVKGRVVGPRTVELNESVPESLGAVEVVLLPSEGGAVDEDVVTFIRRLPPGSRTKEDIDRQLREERGAWDRG
jgi:hypothetical protein